MDYTCRPLSKGFTMIELIVVVAILGFLSVFVVSRYTHPQKEARDNRRLADIASIRSALDYFYLDKGFYPPQPAYQTAGIGLISLIPEYLHSLPRDPRGGRDYYYVSRLPGHQNEQNCCLSAQMELEEFAEDYRCEGYGSHGESAYTVTCR